MASAGVRSRLAEAYRAMVADKHRDLARLCNGAMQTATLFPLTVRDIAAHSIRRSRQLPFL